MAYYSDMDVDSVDSNAKGREIKHMRVIVTGGCGYVGHALVPKLLSLGHQVTVVDTEWFGNYHELHKRLICCKVDIRDRAWYQLLHDADAVIHMACISNDPSFELDESLSRTINFECFEPMVIAARDAGVKRFIYASSSSVYGISDAPKVTEEHPLVPITLYNTFKAKCEPILLKYASQDFICTVLRPSTICGYSRRQRLDLAVNILTNLAINTGVITVHGGEQKRPNLHIDDMVDAYMVVLEAPARKINGETFNVGCGNASISQLAEIVQEEVGKFYAYDETGKYTAYMVPRIEHTGSVDKRSYQVDSSKIRHILGFKPWYDIRDAVRDLCGAFANGKIPDAMTDDKYYNVRRMRAVWADLYKDAPPLKVDPTKGHLSEIDVLHR